ncbi:hypothetical protein [Streptomyces sp. NPDC020607]|uniref:hypothetical protein n=1 Tax=Streptomyces sp. NPDC020607 TaxID=3365082 RepID=UPI0037B38F05
MTREELLARARRHMWAAWALSAEEVGSQAAETLLGLGMLVPEGGAAELERLRVRVSELEAERHSTNEALSDAMVERSADRWTAFFAPTQALREDEPAVEQRLIAYRAEHPDSGIVLRTYSNREAAVAHCEALATREGATGLVSWVPDDGDAFSPEELTYFDVEYCDGDDVPVQTCTGYVVTPLEIASAYDEEANE